MDKLFLLDAYALIYRAYYAFLKAPRINSKGFNTSAILGFVNTLEDILNNEKPTHIGVAFDPKGGTFRHELYKEYKAQREETPEVIRESVPIIKQILEAYRIPVLEVAGFEADDVIGTLSKKADEKGITTYMMTPDKDYCQLVTDKALIYRPRYGNNGYDIMGPAQVKEKYGLDNTCQIIDMLGLMGDSSDNIPGCPGIGEKTAVKLITEFGGIDGLLANTDKLKGALKEKVESNVDQIKFSRLLATIRTDVPIELDMESLKFQGPDEQKLYSIFEDLEFRTLMNRVKSKQTDAVQTEQTAQPKQPKNDGFHGDLFDLFQPASQPAQEFSNLKDIKNTQHTYYLIETEKDAESLAHKITTSDFFCFDTETTGTDAISAQIVGLSIALSEHEAWYVAMPRDTEGKQRMLEIFRSVFENPSTLKIGQNIKYDILILGNYGIQVEGPLFDTMIAHYLIQPELHHNMDYLAEIYLGYKTIHIEELIGEKGRNQKNMADLSPADIYEYAAEDADITLQLKSVLERELDKDGTTPLFRDVEMPLVSVLAYMERNGAMIDPKALAET
jgi:DNA polymerase-1